MRKLIIALFIFVIPTLVFADTYMSFNIIDKGYTGGNIEGKRNRRGIDRFEHLGTIYPSVPAYLIKVKWEKNGVLMYRLDVGERTANRLAGDFAEFDATVLTGVAAHRLINNYFHYSGVTK